MREKIGIIAIGQAGGNIGKLLKLKGFDVAFINSSKGDLDTLNIDKNIKYHIKNGLGCAKDRDTAKQVAKNDFSAINEFIDKVVGKKDLYYIVSSTGGGTGSGISPTLANIFIKALKKDVGLVSVLPSEKDTLQAKINSYEYLKEITEIEDLCGCFILDNNQKNDMEHINKNFVNLFNKIFDYKKYETVKGNIDEAEIFKLLKTKGMISLASCKNDENTNKLIENINNGVFAKLEKGGTIKYLGLSRSIKFDENLFFEQVGKYLDKFENNNKEYTLAILSGLTFPLKRISNLKEEISKEKETIIKLNTENIVKLDDIDFLNTKNKKEDTQVKETMSTDDILNMFF